MEEQVLAEKKNIGWKSAEVEEMAQTLSEKVNIAPLLDPKNFGGRLRQGDIIQFGKPRPLVVSSKGDIQVRALLRRDDTMRGIFIPLQFFLNCWYYKGNAADLMTTYPDMAALLDYLVNAPVAIKVIEVDFRPDSEIQYRYTLELEH